MPPTTKVFTEQLRRCHTAPALIHRVARASAQRRTRLRLDLLSSSPARGHLRLQTVGALYSDVLSPDVEEISESGLQKLFYMSRRFYPLQRSRCGAPRKSCVYDGVSICSIIRLPPNSPFSSQSMNNQCVPRQSIKQSTDVL